MSPDTFVDTNILIYAISTASAEHAKREAARELLFGSSWGVSVQVLQEFYLQVTRPNRPHALTHDRAVTFVRFFLRRPVQDMTTGVLERAFALSKRYGFSYWDSAVVAAALALGCRELCTEDLSHGQRIEGLTVVNPFVRRS